MALFENFPYTNMQQLNLNWIIKKLKELENTSVLSVNGMTGEVVLYTDRSVQLPAILGEDLHNWAFWRLMNGTASGIQFTETGVEWVNGQNRIKLLTTDDIPTSAGVVAVNGKTGVVVLLGTDMVVSDTDNRTVAQAIDSIMTSEETIAGEVADLADDVSGLNTAVGTLNTQYNNLVNQRIVPLETSVTSLNTQVSGNTGDITDLQTDVSALQDDTGDLNQAISGLTSSISTINGSLTNINASILSLQQQLTAKKLRRVFSQHSNVTISSTGYYLIDSYTSLNIDTNEYALVSMNIRGWSGGISPITLAKGANGTDFYIISPEQTITQIQIEYFFAPSNLWS